jgi:hypothetical protein
LQALSLRNSEKGLEDSSLPAGRQGFMISSKKIMIELLNELFHLTP